ncbi:hypothetical protein BCR42DRAFT_467930 [Absidia repens]|uniref:NADH:flavin oxidoreductase/NADH oxidase N-terminal domain-containing protein n=1 Tax=Absidia repens TaxID=90262 RepID=A0A1X2IAK4_9FUNG|nr:hypothetical protein BCR42DRAFT_467930 [Absidia repens]
MSDTSIPTLFTPMKIGPHVLTHRLVLAPLTRFRCPNGVPSVDVPIYYQQRATEGGMMITEATAISPYAGGYSGTPGIYTQEQIEAWKRVTAAVHDKKGIIFMQIWHLGRASFSCDLPNNSTPVSASDIAIESPSPLGGGAFEKPRSLSVDEIKLITQDFVQAAKNAINAGFDGVEIHSGNGYLLDQFINTSSNKRSDMYGGSIENRTRLPLEIIGAVAKAIGNDRTAIRCSPYSGFHDMQDDTTMATWSYLVQQLEKNHPDLAYIHFVEPRVDLMSDELPAEQEENQDSEAEMHLDVFRALWSGPFVSAGNYSYSAKHAYDRAENSPRNLVAVGRAFISNPDLVDRFRNHWNLAPYDRATFYSSGPEGYIDYPFYNAAN